MTSPWVTLRSSLRSKIDLPMTLCGGQCFRWHKGSEEGSFIGVIGRSAFELRKRAAAKAGTISAVEYRNLHSADSAERRKPSVDEALLRHYLSLDVDLPLLWRQWTVENDKADHPLVEHLIEGVHANQSSAKVVVPTEPYADIRHLRQDLHETLFSFVCSQNNHVKRITAMVDALCAKYGDHICTVPALCMSGRGKAPPRAGPSTAAVQPHKRRKTEGDSAFQSATSPARSSATSMEAYTFPTVSQLRQADEVTLREMGFGYRSKFIVGCVRAISEYRSDGSPTGTARRSNNVRLQQHYQSTLAVPFYCDLLACATVDEQRMMLMSLPGVGRKVADCVLLFALGHSDLVPVDTHMAQVAASFLSSPVASRKARGPSQKGKTSGAAKGEGAYDWQEEVRAWGMKKKVDTSKTNRGHSVATRGAEAKSRGRGASTKRAEKAFPPLAAKHHDAIQQGFRELFGPHAGWAHSILFYRRMR